MKINYYLFALLFISLEMAAQNPFNTHIKFNLDEFKTEYDSLHIEVELFDSFLGSQYHLYQKFIVPSDNIAIDLSLPEVSSGIINIKHNGNVLSGSGSTVFCGDTLVGKLGIYKELVVRGGENDYMQENFMLPFSLPSVIANNNSFQNKMVQRSYTLKIPENPMLEAMYKEYLRNVLSLVKERSGSFHILNRLLKSADNISLETLDTAISMFDERIINTTKGKKLKSYVANAKWILEKPNLNEVQLMDVKGRKISMDSIFHPSKFTFIDFWASWCVPCRQFNVKLVEKYSNLDNSKIQIISISLDEDLRNWEKAISKDKLPWLNFLDPSIKGFNGDLAKLFNIQFIPQSFLFDKNGEIVSMNLPIEELLQIAK